MLGDDVMVIPDAMQDDRFIDNDLVTGAPHIRFYAGYPLRTPDGVPLGALHLSGSSSQWSGADYAKKFSPLLLNAIAQYERRNA